MKKVEYKVMKKVLLEVEASKPHLLLLNAQVSC